jgi:hypothetical protein
VEIELPLLAVPVTSHPQASVLLCSVPSDGSGSLANSFRRAVLGAFLRRNTAPLDKIARIIVNAYTFLIKYRTSAGI